MTFVPFVRSWLRVSGSVRSHLFLLIDGGGGEPSGPFFCMPCGSSFFSGACSGACPTGSRIEGSDFYFFIIFLLCIVLHICFSMSSSHFTVGFAGVPVFMGTSDVTIDMGFLLGSFLSPLYRHCC